MLACRDRMDSLERARVNTWYHALSALIKAHGAMRTQTKDINQLAFTV